MSPSNPAPVPGQLQKPNPIELFYEKNKRLVTVLAVLLVAGIAARYALRHFRQVEVNRVWSAFAAVTGLDKAYAEEGNFGPAGLLMSMGEDIGEVDPARLDQALAELAGTEAEPLLLWIKANRAMRDREFGQAESTLQDLESRFPDHFLCQKSDFPVQWRDTVEKEDEESTPTPPNEPPEYVEPKSGSAVKRALAAVASAREFERANPRFYEVPEPDAEQRARITFEHPDRGEVDIVIGFYKSAPEHAAKFAELATAGFWNGLRVHMVRRPGEGQQAAFTAGQSEFEFGWTSTRVGEEGSDDRTTWVAGEVAEEHTLEWENSGLSHFPFMVAAEAHTKDGKSQMERLSINCDDVAALRDGTRVVFARVIEGQEIVESIVKDAEFASQADNEAGSGKPTGNYTIKSVVIE